MFGTSSSLTYISGDQVVCAVVYAHIILTWYQQCPLLTIIDRLTIMSWREPENTFGDNVFDTRHILHVHLQIPSVNCIILGPINTTWILVEPQGQTLGRDTLLSWRKTCKNPIVSNAVAHYMINYLDTCISLYH